MVDEAEYDRWRAAAAGALAGAEVQHVAQLYNWACFMAEQAAQLAVKGLLHGVGGAAWGDDLRALEARLESQIFARVPSEISAALTRLARHYIPTRYPDALPGGPPSRYYQAGDARQALDDALNVLTYCHEMWQNIVSSANSS